MKTKNNESKSDTVVIVIVLFTWAEEMKVQNVFWTSYVQSVYVWRPGGHLEKCNRLIRWTNEGDYSWPNNFNLTF